MLKTAMLTMMLGLGLMGCFDWAQARKDCSFVVCRSMPETDSSNYRMSPSEVPVERAERGALRQSYLADSFEQRIESTRRKAVRKISSGERKSAVSMLEDALSRVRLERRDDVEPRILKNLIFALDIVLRIDLRAEKNWLREHFLPERARHGTQHLI